jgi:hypothetical protein
MPASNTGSPRDPLSLASGQSRRAERLRCAMLSIPAGLVAVAVAMWWAAPQGMLPPLAQAPSRSVHVAEIVPTDATYTEAQRAFGDGSACWRVSILDAYAAPVAAARVNVDLIGIDGAVWAHLVATTGEDGSARFSYRLGTPTASGVYTIRVIDVWHGDPGIVYDRAVNTASANSFSVTARPRRPAVHSR